MEQLLHSCSTAVLTPFDLHERLQETFSRWRKDTQRRHSTLHGDEEVLSAFRIRRPCFTNSIRLFELLPWLRFVLLVGVLFFVVFVCLGVGLSAFFTATRFVTIGPLSFHSHKMTCATSAHKASSPVQKRASGPTHATSGGRDSARMLPFVRELQTSPAHH